MNELNKYNQDYWNAYDGESELVGLSPFGLR